MNNIHFNYKHVNGTVERIGGKVISISCDLNDLDSGSIQLIQNNAREEKPTEFELSRMSDISSSRGLEYFEQWCIEMNERQNIAN